MRIPFGKRFWWSNILRPTIFSQQGFSCIRCKKSLLGEKHATLHHFARNDIKKDRVAWFDEVGLFCRECHFKVDKERGWKISKALKNKPKSLEHKLKVSRAITKLWKNPKYREMRRHAYKELEDKILKKYYSNTPARIIREKFLPHRTVKSITSRARRLKLKVDYSAKAKMAKKYPLRINTQKFLKEE